MEILMSWLKDYTNLKCDAKTFVDKMTLSGSKVETFKELGKEISNVVVGKILEIEKHPDADKLSVTKVEVGNKEVIQIVTGAPNINVGDIIPVALHGSTLPGGVKIKKGKLRGIESNGMMCGIEELGFDKDSFDNNGVDGIYIFKEELELGQDVKELFGLNDTVVEFEITSNRPDCFSMIGLAREAAVTFKEKFTYPKIEVKEDGGNANDYISVEIKNSDLCKRYAARIIKNVKIGPSPKWMQIRLNALGVRPINNIVDITNYVMLEMGQPMHAFDFNLLEDKKIIVRNAQKDEKIMTLDGVERTLDESMLVIADNKKATAIAGVMGGENSKILDNTNTIVFESATFDGTNIRLTSKKVGLRTDASAKFEKNLDPNLAIEAVNRAVQLVVELGAGEVVEGIIDIYPNKVGEKVFDYSVEKINKLLGTDISENEMIEIFESLEFKVDRDNKKITIPTFRQDIEHNADLAEEVARFYGYDNIKPTLAIGTPTVGKFTYEQKIENIIKNVMQSQGFSEAMTYSFESPKVFDKLLIKEDDNLRNTVTISNPLGEDFSIMRTVPFNGMIQSLATNYNRRNKEASLYEIGKIYLPKALPLTELPDERKILTVGMYGQKDFYDIKGSIEQLLETLGINEEEVTYKASSDLSYIHPGRCAEIFIGQQKLGLIGEIHPQVAKNYGIETKAYIAGIDVKTLVENVNFNKKYKALPKFPTVTRDIALLVKEEVMVGQIEDIIKKQSGKILEICELFDIYRGNQVAEGYKSIAYSIRFRAEDRTLTEEEVVKVMDKILKTLEVELDAKLRA